MALPIIRVITPKKIFMTYPRAGQTPNCWIPGLVLLSYEWPSSPLKPQASDRILSSCHLFLIFPFSHWSAHVCGAPTCIIKFGHFLVICLMSIWVDQPKEPGRVKCLLPPKRLYCKYCYQQQILPLVLLSKAS